MGCIELCRQVFIRSADGIENILDRFSGAQVDVHLRAIGEDDPDICGDTDKRESVQGVPRAGHEDSQIFCGPRPIER
ncbi:hypothetical protein DSLASN_18160 [Desulfoluna limicola]|uniref:Uncharacterized protein n=1 Tax=Desulfoluna limicola TaxID=2810562 RepID=A0ABN6F0W3_9BACT|nr:hypothetical protein DSLASN_18160 [Desulfoluna limicola]